MEFGLAGSLKKNTDFAELIRFEVIIVPQWPI